MDINVLDWFILYLGKRKQYVDIGGCWSSLGNITCGVPQESILGPFLFTLYVTDMVNAVSCDLFSYADNTALMVAVKMYQT